MRKIVSLVTMLAVMVSVIGCSGGENPADTNPGAAPGNKGAVAPEGGGEKTGTTEAKPSDSGLAPQ